MSLFYGTKLFYSVTFVVRDIGIPSKSSTTFMAGVELGGDRLKKGVYRGVLGPTDE